MTLTAAAPPYQTVFEKSFDDVRHLLIALPNADVTLQATEDKALRIEAKIIGDEHLRAASLYDRLRLRARHNEQAVKFEMPPLPHALLAEWAGFEVPPIAVQIEVPRAVQVDASVAGGTINASGLKGRLTLESKGGTLHGSDLQGRLEVIGLGSAIILDGIKGPNLVLRTAGGTLQADGLAADRQKLQISSSEAHISRLIGPSDWRFTDADVRVDGIEGAVQGHLYGGRLQLTMEDAAPVHLESVRTEVDLRD